MPLQPRDGRLVQQFFDSSAAGWEDVYHDADVFGAGIRRRHATALNWVDRLALAPMSSVLEVGCGAGLLSVALAQRGMAVHAIDAAPAMVTLTRRHALEARVDAKLEVRIGDVHTLEFADASFDLVIALGVLPWLHSPTRALREMARVLNSGGWLIVSADNRARLPGLLDPLRNPVLGRYAHAAMRAARGGQADVVRPRADRRRAVDRILSTAGLRKVEGTTCGFGPLTICRQRVVPERIGVAIERYLQRLADRRFPGIRSAGWHYLVLARRSASP